MTRITGDWIARPETQAVCQALSRGGNRVLFVGGCVRNALLGVAVNDIDLTTDARPETVITLAKAAGLKPIPTGIDHGTVTVVSDGIPHEITTFRRDVETTGRHATIAFTDKVEDDARRRDFTMNALYAEPDGTLIDPLGGLPDLLARKVRFIEDANARICEDYLRILRFFRFQAWYGDPAQGLDAEGLAACAANSAGLETLSRERIGAELMKLLAAADPGPSVAVMAATGCLRPVLPGSDPKALPVLVHLESECAVPPKALRRLAVLGGENVKDRLRLSNSAAKELCQIRDAALSMASAAEMGYRFGFDTGVDAVLVRSALLETPPVQDFRDEIQTGAGARFPVSAGDLIGRFQGAGLGARLEELEDWWIASGFSLTKDQLLAQD